jgi:hypothetical protein
MLLIAVTLSCWSWAESHNITVVCLLTHTTQVLQLLYRSFFKALKIYYNQEAIIWMRNHEERNITRYEVGALIGRTCGKAASVSNGSLGFKVIGLFPLNPNVILDHFFSIANNSVTPLVETEPQLSTSTSNKFRDPEPSASSATDGADTPPPNQSGPKDSRGIQQETETKCNHSNITGTYQQMKGC